MVDYWKPFNNALAGMRQTAEMQYNVNRQRGIDEERQNQNALANQYRQMQMAQAFQQMQMEQEEQERVGAFRNALAGANLQDPNSVQGLYQQFPVLSKNAGLADAAIPRQPKYSVHDTQGGLSWISDRPGMPVVPTGARAPEKKPLVEVNTGDSGLPGKVANEALMKKTGEMQAARLDEITRLAQAGIERQYGIQLQRTAIEEGLRTGAFAPLVNAVSSYVEGFGVDPKKLNLPDPSKGQVFDMATFDNLLKALQAQKGPQTEGDAQRALKTFASMKNTEEANLFILDYMDALAIRQQEMADFVDEKFASDYANTNRPVAFAEKEFRTWARKTPLVGKSRKTDVPITYYKYKEAALARGINEDKIDQEWRDFLAGK